MACSIPKLTTDMEHLDPVTFLQMSSPFDCNKRIFYNERFEVCHVTSLGTKRGGCGRGGMNFIFRSAAMEAISSSSFSNNLIA